MKVRKIVPFSLKMLHCRARAIRIVASRPFFYEHAHACYTCAALLTSGNHFSAFHYYIIGECVRVVSLILVSYIHSPYISMNVCGFAYDNGCVIDGMCATAAD